MASCRRESWVGLFVSMNRIFVAMSIGYEYRLMP